MIQQSILDLNLTQALVAGLPPSGAAAGSIEYRRCGTSRGLARKSILDLEHLESVETWLLEPYQGLEFETLVEKPRSRAHKRRILVNETLPAALRRELSHRGRERLSIKLGDPFEAYPSAEQRLGITRSILRSLGQSRGHQIDLNTRSPLILRDHDLLQSLDMSHAITVRVPIATLDSTLASRLEPNATTPRSRLEIVRSLAGSGISVVVSCGPIVPGLNTSADELDPLFAAVRRAGAYDIVADARASAPRYRIRLAAWLDRHVPEQKELILGRLSRHRIDSHLATFDRLRLSYGFPVQRAGRG